MDGQGSLDCDWLGFDLDHTLVRYRLPALAHLVQQSLIRYLVEKAAWPCTCFARSDALLGRFMSKGMIGLTEKGLLVKIAEDGKVLKAFHGTAPIQMEGEVLSDVASHILGGQRSPTFFNFCTYFDMPGASVYAMMVDAYLAGDVEVPAFPDIMRQLLDAFNYNFHSDHFSQRVGWYFPPILDAPEKYLYRAPPHLLAWLKQCGKKCFLLTNSHGDYTNHLCNYVFGHDWRDLFDLIVVKGEKPKFFEATSLQSPFHHLSDCGSRAGHPADLEPGRTFVHGNAKCLERFLSVHGNFSRGDEQLEPIESPTEAAAEVMVATGETNNTRVAYFGDHLIGDIVAVRKNTQWKAISIVEEELLEENVLSEEADIVARDFLSASLLDWGSFWEQHPSSGSKHIFASLVDRFAHLSVAHL